MVASTLSGIQDNVLLHTNYADVEAYYLSKWTFRNRPLARWQSHTHF